jgi:FkbM family methyltransferase
MLKGTINRTLGLFGYIIGRSNDPFAVQRQLIRRESPMIFDIGANVGLVTQQYRSLFPTATIHSFEPFSQSFLLLERRCSDDRNIFPHQVAICEDMSKRTLYSNHSADTNSLLPKDSRFGALWGEGLSGTESPVQVESTTLDCFCDENNIPTIDILKMDIQGAELRALQGAQKLLARQAIALIYLEIIVGETYIGQPKFHEYIQRLDSCGYELFDLYHSVRKNMRLIAIDALFINQKLKEAWWEGKRNGSKPVDNSSVTAFYLSTAGPVGVTFSSG